MDNDSTKFFPNLTDKDFFNKIKLYDYLYNQHLILQDKIHHLTMDGFYDKKASETLAKSKLYYNYLKQDIEVLKVLYRSLSLNHLKERVQNFKNFVKGWTNIIKHLNTIVAKLEIKKDKNNQQKTR